VPDPSGHARLTLPAREGRESYRGVYSRAFRRGWARHASSLPKTRVIV